jgi:hypothetical protein
VIGHRSNKKNNREENGNGVVNPLYGITSFQSSTHDNGYSIACTKSFRVQVYVSFEQCVGSGRK